MMITIQEYLLSKKHNKLEHTIHATYDTIRQIVKDEIKRLGDDADLNHIDVSKVTNMAGLFKDYKNNNIDISEWDVSNVKQMQFMFYGCENFNQDLSKWDVSKVEDMTAMFGDCKKFNQDLSKWDVRNVKYHSLMFDGCHIKEEYKPKFKD